MGVSEETIQALYGTMEYFDPFGNPFEETKMTPASTTKPTEQTKMAQGGYLDNMLSEEISVDDLIKLLR
jgi:hypothetical protein